MSMDVSMDDTRSVVYSNVGTSIPAAKMLYASASARNPSMSQRLYGYLVL